MDFKRIVLYGTLAAHAGMAAARELSVIALFTGATQVAMNKNEAHRLGIDYARTGIEAAVHTASGITRSYQITLREVRVGDIVLAAVPASIIDGDFPQQLLLGNSFLNRIEMRRDGAMMELRKK